GSLSIWGSTATPRLISATDTAAGEVGVKFSVDYSGFVTGVRVYKGSTNTGTHVGHLWTASGALLAPGTLPNETGSRWQQANLSAPVAISANTTYVVSYYVPNGGYSADIGYFMLAGTNSGPLHAPADGAASGGQGVYRYGVGGGFPNLSYQATNYWVDVVFNGTTTDTTPATVTGQTPAAGA